MTWPSLFFLLIIIFQQIPGVSPFDRWVVLFPWGLNLLGITGLRWLDLAPDLPCHPPALLAQPPSQQSALASSTSPPAIVHVLDHTRGVFVDRPVDEVNVGSVVCIREGETTPLDIVCLATSERQGWCLLDLSRLHGFAELEIKNAPECSRSFNTSSQLAGMEGTVVLEYPPGATCGLEQVKGGMLALSNGFEGEGDLQTATALDASNLFPRGSRLAFTAYVYGVVALAPPPPQPALCLSKERELYHKTEVEGLVDAVMRALAIGVVVVSFFGAIGGIVEEARAYKTRQYLLSTSHTDSAEASRVFFKDWLAFLVGMANVCPLWLPFLLGATKRTLGIMLSSDLDLYDSARDIPAQCRRPAVLDELGKVDYIFLDKTGTLTSGHIALAHISTGGESFAKAWDETQASCLASLPLGPDRKPNLSSPSLSWATLADNLVQIDRSTLNMRETTHSRSPAIMGGNRPPYSSHPAFGSAWSKDRVTHEMLLALSLCHTVIPFWTGNKIAYQGSSPDEVAAVQAAATLGYRLIARQPGEIFVNFCKHETERFEVLYLCPFHFSRRCMSLVVRCAGGAVRLYVKGADQVVFPRLADPGGSDGMPTSVEVDARLAQTLRHLHAYASDGLRTMVYAAREVPPAEWEKWESVLQRWLSEERSSIPEKAHAGANWAHREEDILAHMMEALAGQSLTLLGVTGGEDGLCEGVKDTVQALHKAGIKPFLLSGDQKETVLTTAVQSTLLDPRLSLVTLDQPTIGEAAQHAENVLMALHQSKKRARHPLLDKNRVQQFALVIQGDVLDAFSAQTPGSLPRAGSKQMSNASPEREVRQALLDSLLELILLSQAVIIPRASGEHKACFTSWVRDQLTAHTLAVGDGENDEGMLRAAHVGVGVFSPYSCAPDREEKENFAHQDPRTFLPTAADLTVSEFRMLRKLMFVHGSWSYARVSKMVMYMLYATTAWYALDFWYAIHSSWSGQAPMEGWEMTFFFSTFFLLPPALALGLFDQPLKARMLDRYPQLYGAPILTLQRACDYLLNGLVHSCCIYFLVTYGLWGDVHLSGGFNATEGIYGQTLFFSALATVLLKAVVMCNTVNVYTLLAWVGTYLVAIVWCLLWTIIAPLIPGIYLSWDLHGLVPRLYPLSLFWFACLLVPVVANMRDALWRFWQRTYRPESVHLVQEVQKLNVHDYKARLTKYQKNRKQVAASASASSPMRKRRWGGGGFAFAQRSTPRSAWSYADASRTSSTWSTSAPGYADVEKGSVYNPGWTQADFALSFDSSLARWPQAADVPT